MTDFDHGYARIRRRETTSPRSALAITIALMAIVGCGYLASETILYFFGQAPLLADPATMVNAVVAAPSVAPAALIAIGAAAALVGLVLIVLAVTPGHRSRHLVESERTLTLVDDEVIASALSRRAAREAGIDPDAARVTVSRRRAIVTLTAFSGTPVLINPVGETVSKQLADYRLSPPVTSSVRADPRRKVGA